MPTFTSTSVPTNTHPPTHKHKHTHHNTHTKPQALIRALASLPAEPELELSASPALLFLLEAVDGRQPLLDDPEAAQLCVGVVFPSFFFFPFLLWLWCGVLCLYRLCVMCACVCPPCTTRRRAQRSVELLAGDKDWVAWALLGLSFVRAPIYLYHALISLDNTLKLTYPPQIQHNKQTNKQNYSIKVRDGPAQLRAGRGLAGHPTGGGHPPDRRPAAGMRVMACC